VRDDHLTVERNPNYWRASEGLPHLDEIEFRPIIEDDVRLAALEAGDVDAIMVGDGQIAELRERSDEFTLAETNQGVAAIVYNNGLPLFQDVRVRKGLGQAIDVQALVDTTWDGVGGVATGPMPADNPFAGEVDYPSYDPEAAKAMLAEYTAETGNAVAFTLVYGEGVIAAELAQLLQQYWQDAGAQVTLGAPVPAGDFPGIMATHEYEVSLYGVPGFIDPDVWLNIEFRSDSFLNIGAINSPEIDAALGISHASTDFDERTAAYADMQRVLAEEVQWYFLHDEVAAVAARPGVEGLNEFPMLDGTTGLTKQGQFYTPFAVEALRITG
jgi:peptide/nickel transport system substrate-binding protein